jgi:hypothetical protein
MAEVVRAVQVNGIQQGSRAAGAANQRPAVTPWSSTSTVARPAACSASNAPAMVAGRRGRGPDVLSRVASWSTHWGPPRWPGPPPGRRRPGPAGRPGRRRRADLGRHHPGSRRSGRPDESVDHRGHPQGPTARRSALKRGIGLRGGRLGYQPLASATMSSAVGRRQGPGCTHRCCRLERGSAPRRSRCRRPRTPRGSPRQQTAIRQSRPGRRRPGIPPRGRW